MPDPGPHRPPVPPPRAAAPPHAVRLTLVAHHVLAPDVVEIRLRPPPGADLAWRAGQYLDLIPPDGRLRSFSIANPPPGDGVAPFVPGPGGDVAAGDLVLHVRLGNDTSFSRVLAALPLGSVLDAEVARGSFQVLPPGTAGSVPGPGPALWLAGGTGLAPLMAMLAVVLPGLAGDDAPLQHLFWGVRDEADLYAAPTLDAWAARFPAFAWTPVLSSPPATWAGAEGLVHEVLLERHGDLSGFHVYASGPPAMIATVRTSLPAAGLTVARLHYEHFEPPVTATR